MRNTIMTLPIRTLRALLVPFLVLSTAWAAPTFHVLHAFSGGATDGSNPNSRLTLDRLGDLFGEAFSGGSTGCSGNGCGVAFELSFKNGHWRDSNFYSFSSLNGGFPNPEFAVALDAAGNVYGTEYSGGDPACNCGSIFQLTRIGGVWTLNTLHTFTGQPSDGAYPSSGLFRDASRNLFGSTRTGAALTGRSLSIRRAISTGQLRLAVSITMEQSTRRRPRTARGQTRFSTTSPLTSGSLLSPTESSWLLTGTFTELPSSEVSTVSARFTI